MSQHNHPEAPSSGRTLVDPDQDPFSSPRYTHSPPATNSNSGDETAYDPVERHGSPYYSDNGRSDRSRAHSSDYLSPQYPTTRFAENVTSHPAYSSQLGSTLGNASSYSLSDTLRDRESCDGDRYDKGELDDDHRPLTTSFDDRYVTAAE